MRLVLLHPEVAAVSCRECQDYQYDQHWQPVRRHGGDKQKRHPGTPTPCASCPKVPEGLAESVKPVGVGVARVLNYVAQLRQHAVEVKGRVLAAIVFHLECRAVGAFPDDPIVRQNAAILGAVEQEARGKEEMDRLMHLAILLRARSG